VLTVLKTFARKSKTSIVAYKIFDNVRLRRKFKSGKIETQHGSTHKGKSTAESLDYISAQFADYLKYSGLSEQQLGGRRVLELGSGDNVGLALRFLASGAARVVCVDKFYSQRNSDQQLAIYRALRNTLPTDHRHRFDDAINLESNLAINPEKLRCIYGVDLEDATAGLKVDEGTFDMIISRAVIEEIYLPDGVFEATDKLLAAGGLILHKIDLSDYGIFSGGGMHPLTFLTIPETIYRMMASDSGIPNRKLIGYYRNKLKELRYESKLFITSLLGQGTLDPHKETPRLNDDYTEATLALVDQIRPKLRGEYKDMSNEDLIVDGIFIIGKKLAN
jgi:hypothetical protein